MSPRLFLLRVIEPGLALLPTYMVCNQSRVALMAIAGQESNWAARQQVGGPAVGYWQFEESGITEVIAKQGHLVQVVLGTLDIPILDLPVPAAHAAIQYNDPLACAFARLLLWSDPEPLPAIGDTATCWQYYERLWRPGKPDVTRWAPAYAMAVSTVASG